MRGVQEQEQKQAGAGLAGAIDKADDTTMREVLHGRAVSPCIMMSRDGHARTANHTPSIALYTCSLLHITSPTLARSLGEADRIPRELDKLYAKIAPVT